MDKQGSRFINEDMALRRYLEAIEKGEVPNNDDLKRVGRMAELYMTMRPNFEGRPSEKAKRFPWFVRIEGERLKGASVEEAVREVFTSDQGNLDQIIYERYMGIYTDNKHSDERKAARQTVELAKKSSKKFTEAVDASIPAFKKAVNAMERMVSKAKDRT